MCIRDSLPVEHATFDLVLLDMMLPGMDGPGFVGQVRERVVRTPIVVVSAKASAADKVDMLKLGADDYVTKPFDPDEVAARIHAVLRRAGSASPGPAASSSDLDETYAHRDLRLDVARRRVTLGDAEVALTAHEFDILHVLIREPDKVFSRERLYELVWKSGYYGEENAVNVHEMCIRDRTGRSRGDVPRINLLREEAGQRSEPRRRCEPMAAYGVGLGGGHRRQSRHIDRKKASPERMLADGGRRSDPKWLDLEGWLPLPHSVRSRSQRIVHYKEDCLVIWALPTRVAGRSSEAMTGL